MTVGCRPQIHTGFFKLRSSPIYIRGEDRPVRELPTRDGRPECDAACSGAGPSEMMALVSLVPKGNSWFYVYFNGGPGGAGLANFAASMEAFNSTERSSMIDRPSVQVVVSLKGILIPATSR